MCQNGCMARQVGPRHSELILNENYVVRIMATEMSMKMPHDLDLWQNEPKHNRCSPYLTNYPYSKSEMGQNVFE